MEHSRNLMDSASAMSRFKVQNGIKVMSQNQGSSYILMSKIKKALKTEITNEVFNAMRRRYFTRNSEVRRDVFLDRMVSKIDMFTNDQLLYTLSVYETDGIDALVDTLRLPQLKLRRLTSAYHNSLRQYEESDDDSSEEVPELEIRDDGEEEDNFNDEPWTE